MQTGSIYIIYTLFTYNKAMSEEIRQAYETAAIPYRKKYDAIPVRIPDIDHALSFVRVKQPKILEIGCAYGREAQYLVTKSSEYIGIDISSTYIAMAKAEVPDGEFICADVMEYEFPPNTGAVFAFASLLHNSKEDLAVLLRRLEQVLEPGGIIFLSLKRRNQYDTAIVTDDLVARRFYYYNRPTVLNMLPDTLEEVYYDEQELSEGWLTMVIQKKPF